MKAGLKRIEATLHDLGNRSTALGVEVDDSKKQSFSFRISVAANASPNGEMKKEHQDTEDENNPEPNLFPHNESVQTFPVDHIAGKVPSLPKFKTPSFSTHRHGANPALSINLLQEIQEIVIGWQTELQGILHQVQNLYLEGPIINGWLESNPQESEPGGTATLRHAEVDRLMDYVEEICDTSPKSFSRTGYRLFGVDDSGKVWSRVCPPDQVPSVSVAIARYQKLRQLLGRKQYLETRLSQLAETLVGLRSQIQG